MLEAGDLLLWDSRLVHCSQGVDTSVPPKMALPGRETAALGRLVAYVCMVPKIRVPEATAQLRAQWAREGLSTHHHPCRGVDLASTTTAARRKPSMAGKGQKQQHVVWDLV